MFAKSQDEVQMKALTVSSRAIKSVYFSQDDGRLLICFKNGEERLFSGVPEEAAAAMVNAISPGKHYVEKIRQHYKRVA